MRTRLKKMEENGILGDGRIWNWKEPAKMETRWNKMKLEGVCKNVN